MAAIFHILLLDSHKFLFFHRESIFWTEGVQRGAKDITEVRKPGGHGKVASVQLIFQIKTRKVSHECFNDFLQTLLVIPSNLNHGLGMPKPFKNKILIFFFFFFFATVRNSTSFVLKIRGHYVPGIESIQASIL